MAGRVKIITSNKKALHDYFIIDRIEAGVELKGTEVKSLREGRANLKDSFAIIKNGEVFLLKSHISPYKYGGYDNHSPERPRKLLLKKQEIRRLKRYVEEKGVTLVPLKMYFNERGKVKVELGLARGKKLHDKRASIAERDAKRELERLRRDKL